MFHCQICNCRWYSFYPVGLLQLRNLQSSCLQQRLYHFKFGNTNLYKRKPKVKTLHYKKAELLSVLKPYIPDPDEKKPMWETCGNVVNPILLEPPLTPYETFLSKQLLGHLERSQFVAIVQCNPIPVFEKLRCAVYLGREKMVPFNYTKRVVKATLSGTQYENLLRIFCRHTQFVFCKDPTMKEMLKIFKKYPQYVVVGGFFEDRILTRSSIEEYANLPSLDIVRAQFASVLDSASTQLVRTLGASQSLLVSHLESRVGELKKSCEPPSSTSGAEDKTPPEEAKS